MLLSKAPNGKDCFFVLFSWILTNQVQVSSDKSWPVHLSTEGDFQVRRLHLDLLRVIYERVCSVMKLVMLSYGCCGSEVCLVYVCGRSEVNPDWYRNRLLLPRTLETWKLLDYECLLLRPKIKFILLTTSFIKDVFIKEVPVP